MIYRLKDGETGRVLPLLEKVDHALIVNAVVEGTAPGWIMVDDLDSPRALFASTPEGYHLIGSDQDESFKASLAEFITGKIIPEGLTAGWAVIYLHYYPDDWGRWLEIVFGDLVPLKEYQRYFQLGKLKIDWRQRLPPGYLVRQVDADLLARSDLKNIDALERQAVGNFHSVDGFLRNGFGFCCLHGNTVVSRCMADCVSEQSCEVGIRTDEEYRRRGLATLTVAAAMENCLAKGITKVGWHCGVQTQHRRRRREKWALKR
jgi:GNAT superfamily N-acetyltransferase